VFYRIALTRRNLGADVDHEAFCDRQPDAHSISMQFKDLKAKHFL
jgi:hypothetical protein